MGLKEIIKRNGLSQKDIAERLQVEQSTLSRWVQGHVAPSGPMLVRLLALLRESDPKLDAADLLPPAPSGEAA